MRIRRPAGSLTVLLVAVALACGSCVSYRWRARPLTQVDVERDALARRYVRLETASGKLTLRLLRVDFPFVYGDHPGGTGRVDVDPEKLGTVRFVVDNWKPGDVRYVLIPRDTVRRWPERLEGATIAFETESGEVILHNVHRPPGSWFQGEVREDAGRGLVRVDLRQVSGVAVRQVNGPMTALKTTGAVGGTMAGLLLLVMLTKESCPFVYVERAEGWELVGEAYAGAAFRSTQRTDLLPLPELGAADSLVLRLRNEARETQYTDMAELVVVDHPAGTRALSTHDGQVALVGPSSLPLHATDGRGLDVTRQLAATDQWLAETQVPDVAASADSVVEDVISATFAVRGTGEPVLELVAGNTTLLDVTFGRFFAAMGGRLPKYLSEGNESTAGPRIQRWREREGVDLIVEAREGEGWRQLAVVPTVGAAALRAIAVPVPLTSVAQGRVEVRVRSGLGFWRLDQLALSVRVPDEPTVRRVAPTAALADDGRDQRRELSVVDGRYHALAAMDESLRLSFALPARLAPLDVRSAFLRSSGYYNVHPPLQSSWLPGTLLALRDEPGALARFARDLTRVYEQAVKVR